ncbi:MAG: hypothetical protein AB7K36_00935 [Chloroflexota bacterium]
MTARQRGAQPAAEDQTFGSELEMLMLRAKLWDTALARRLEVSRSEVFRWRTGRSLPSRHNLDRLQGALSWPANGSLIALDPAEWDRLLTLAGHGQPRPALEVDDRNRVELPDRCAVYAYQYERRSFPSEWSRRSTEIEREIQGSMHGMLHRPPTFMRPDSITRLYEQWYDHDVVERYVHDQAERLKLWERRVEEYEVRHIYSKQAMSGYLRSRIWQGQQVSQEQIKDQIELILDVLDRHYPNFSIGLDEDILPFDATIVGHEVVLLTLRQAHMVNAQGWTIFGMEMSGLSVVKTFSQAFDRTWGKRTVTRDPAAVRAWFTSQL